MVARVARTRRIQHTLVALLLAATTLLGAASASIAADDIKNLASASDFRIRVAAALTLGKSKEPGARAALEKALHDANPAVRVAAAAALGALGDAAALPALKAALAKETADDVKTQIQTTMKRLSVKAKFVVGLGKLENKSGVSGSDIMPALKSATREKMAQVPGVEVVADGADVSSASKSRGLPGFLVDGSLVQLAKKQNSDGVGYAARVEYLIRRMPDQALKGTMSGNAQALADANQVRGQSELSQLQSDALAAAVESALKGMSPTLEAAVK